MPSKKAILKKCNRIREKRAGLKKQRKKLDRRIKELEISAFRTRWCAETIQEVFETFELTGYKRAKKHLSIQKMLAQLEVLLILHQ